MCDKLSAGGNIREKHLAEEVRPLVTSYPMPTDPVPAAMPVLSGEHIKLSQCYKGGSMRPSFQLFPLFVLILPIP